MTDVRRPALSPSLSAAELRRWYWTRAELASLARLLGMSTAGAKLDLADRLADTLDGRPPGPPARRPPAAATLPEPVTTATRLPAGQRCTEQLRRCLRAEIGPGFRFDRPMRVFIAAADGHTVGDAIAHWHHTRAAAAHPTDIPAQFELNRFLRDWRQEHPGCSHADALAAWHDHRSRPRPSG